MLRFRRIGVLAVPQFDCQTPSIEYRLREQTTPDDAEKLPPEEVKRILETDPDRPRGSASEYVQRVLNEGVGTIKGGSASLMYSVAAAALPSRPRKQAAMTRSQWEHFSLAPDVELHVRRPVSREDNRRIERLLEAAREIFNEDLP